MTTRNLLTAMGVASLFSANAQNVGIGKENPQVKLDVQSNFLHTARFDGPSGMYVSFFENEVYRGYIGSFGGNPEDVDFGTGGSNATGKVHLSVQGAPALTIRPNGYVGINNTNPQWDLDVNGAVRFDGRLYIQGTSGGAGQVLTSGGGLNKPSWQTLSTAYQNDVRFAISINHINTSTSRNIEYNTNATAVSLPTNGTFVINETGLYHFEGSTTLTLFYTGTTPSNRLNAFFNLSVAGRAFVVADINEEDMRRSNTGSNLLERHSTAWSRDVYVIAGQTVGFGYSWNYNPTNGAVLADRQLTGIISGYKIAD